MSDKENAKERDWGEIANLGLVGGFVFLLVGGLIWETAGKYVHGTTPADLEAVSLEASPKQLGRALSATEVHDTSVRANFRVGPGKPYRYAELTWDNKSSLDAPTSMRLVAEHESEHADDVRAALSRRFHGLHNGDWTWGAVSFSSDKKDGDVSFRIQRGSSSKPNALFERQLDAARQVVLEAAFGIAPRASDQDLAELLGTGYPIADVGKIDPAITVEAAPALVQKTFPGSLNESSASWEIAVSHPLVKSVTLGWTNRRAGRLTSASISVTDAYAPSRGMLESCLETKLGPPKTGFVDYAADKKKYAFAIGPVQLTLDTRYLELGGSDWDAASWSRTFAALGSCTDAAESTGSQGDAKKK